MLLWLYGHFLSRTLISQFLFNWTNGLASSNIHQVFFCGNEVFKTQIFSICDDFIVLFNSHQSFFMLADQSLSTISRDENRTRALIESIKKETKQKWERPKECPNLLNRAGQVANNSTWDKSSSPDWYMRSN